ncbi:CRM1 C terminal-domain-containing protein [Desarmillaria ectypa]|nr:CRM1 C terminal-domain-containing protein [Desarmillaria ectypa]
MESVLDFSRDFDVSSLDKVVMTFYSGQGEDAKIAQNVLTQFEEHPDAWTRVPEILETASFPQTKFIGLQILEKLVSTRWKTLPEGQRQGIRNFIISATVKVTSDEALLRREKLYVNKLNLVLIHVLKQEWPHNWPNFIPELVESSKTNLTLCENNMAILKLLSEEVFDFSAEQMTQAKIANLKQQMWNEFSEIFKLCSEILAEANKVSLVKATLETLYKFLNWIALGYIFETQIIELLVNRFLEPPDSRNVTLRCLAEIARLPAPEYNDRVIFIYTSVMAAMSRIIPIYANIAEVYKNAGPSDEELVLNLALFLTNFFGEHLELIENDAHREILLSGHAYLVKISAVEEREVFKICAEYWAKLLSSLYNEVTALPIGNLSLSLAGIPHVLGDLKMRKDIYAEVLSNLRLVVIERMVKPEEVLVVENDEGEIVREHLKEIDTIVLYKSMRELLIYLTHLDVVDTEAILTRKLAKQVDGTEWSWQNLNTLCWAIGSISGAMNEDTEKRFLVTVIKDLLGLVEQKRGKDNKAVIASDIMYIVGQYPRFLKAHWKFLKTVVNKLFEFMHETHEGVQDMACDTFIKIAQKCRRHFVMQQAGEKEPFVNEILRSLNRITVDLSPQQVHTFYEAVGYMIAAQPNKPHQEKLLAELMDLPNTAWDTLMVQAAQNADVLSSMDNVKLFSNVLKSNVSACISVGPFFLPQLARIFADMLGLYKAVSGIISETVAREGSIASKKTHIRHLRTVKKDILKLMETYIQRADDLESVNNSLIPPLLDAILGDYNQNVPIARDSEVLNLMTVVTNRLGQLLTPQVIPIIEAVFEPTLSMITADFTEFPEHRLWFFKLLEAINRNCFPALLQLQPDQFKMFMNSVFWAIKHTMRDIADVGLSMLGELITKFSQSPPEVAGPFFQQYFTTIMQEIFFVLTDSEHKSGFTAQVAILAKLFLFANTVLEKVPLFETERIDTTNRILLQEYLANLLGGAFPHMQKAQIIEFVGGLNEFYNDGIKFRGAVRDFLIQLKEFSGDELYLDEKEAEAQKKAEQERQVAMSIPGMLKPSQLEEKEENI